MKCNFLVFFTGIFKKMNLLLNLNFFYDCLNLTLFFFLFLNLFFDFIFLKGNKIGN